MGVKSATRVSDASALQDAIQRRVPHIVVEGEISAMPMITLAEGQRLSGGTLRFGASGVRLTRRRPWAARGGGRRSRPRASPARLWRRRPPGRLHALEPPGRRRADGRGGADQRWLRGSPGPRQRRRRGRRQPLDRTAIACTSTLAPNGSAPAAYVIRAGRSSRTCATTESPLDGLVLGSLNVQRRQRSSCVPGMAPRTPGRTLASHPCR